MKKLLIFFVVLYLSQLRTASAQDPGIRDTVRFGNWSYYIPCPACSGIATIPLYVFHDETIIEMVFYLTWTGPIKIIAVDYTTEVDSFLYQQGVNIVGNSLVMGLATFWENPLPPGSRYMGYLVALVNDTGISTIDSYTPNAPPDPPLRFVTSNFEWLHPLFFKAETNLVEQKNKPGDINGDDKLSISDIVYFANYLFRNGAEPINRKMSDMNVDCEINFQDLIYLVNFVLRGGLRPLPGCSE